MWGEQQQQQPAPAYGQQPQYDQQQQQYGYAQQQQYDQQQYAQQQPYGQQQPQYAQQQQQYVAPQQQQPQPVQPVVVVGKDKKWKKRMKIRCLAVMDIVLGVPALLGFGLFCGAGAIAMGVLAMKRLDVADKKSRKCAKKMAKGGIGVAIFGIFLNILMIILIVFVFMKAASTASDAASNAADTLAKKKDQFNKEFEKSKDQFDKNFEDQKKEMGMGKRRIRSLDQQRRLNAEANATGDALKREYFLSKTLHFHLF